MPEISDIKNNTFFLHFFQRMAATAVANFELSHIDFLGGLSIFFRQTILFSGEVKGRNFFFLANFIKQKRIKIFKINYLKYFYKLNNFYIILEQIPSY